MTRVWVVLMDEADENELARILGVFESAEKAAACKERYVTELRGWHMSGP